MIYQLSLYVRTSISKMVSKTGTAASLGDNKLFMIFSLYAWTTISKKFSKTALAASLAR